MNEPRKCEADKKTGLPGGRGIVDPINIASVLNALCGKAAEFKVQPNAENLAEAEASVGYKAAESFLSMRRTRCNIWQDRSIRRHQDLAGADCVPRLEDAGWTAGVMDQSVRTFSVFHRESQ